MNIHRLILQTLLSEPVAKIHPRSMLALCMGAMDNQDSVAPIGPDSARPEEETAGPILEIPIRGTIVHHWTDGLMTQGLVTPTDWIVEALETAAADDAIQGVILDIDSGGGMAQGTPEAAAAIHAFRQVKPIWAVANGAAYSAAYELGAAAGRLLVTPSGGVGSIGTLMIHEDITAMLEEWGVRIEILRASLAENKARFNPFEPLSDEERERQVETLDTLNGQFLADVARYRGLDADGVADVSENGRTFLAADAVERGLADGVATLREARTAMLAVLEGGEEDTDMAERSGEVHVYVNDPGGSFAVEARTLPQNVEVRHLDGLEVRMVEGAERERLEGVGLRFGSQSRPMVGHGGRRFVEMFEPGAFSDSIGQDDQRVLWQHNPEKIFGRVRAGTAQIWATDGELRYTADPPDAQWARDAMESIRRGDVTENSFAFVVPEGGQRWERRGGVDVRVVTKARLFEVGPQTNAAYADTQAAVAKSMEVARAAHRAALPQLDRALTEDLRLRQQVMG
ncbi:MAG TPA: HK97 family phage prohead protease [Longimicrobiales bacterium]|nr:HK97 family phage prohead protease [Longimicrobiales bacterium]